MDLSLTIIQHTFWALVLNEPWPLHQQLRVAAFAILLIFFMDISQLFWWDETWLANLVQFSSSVLLSCRHVREGRLLESKNWPNFALLLPHSGEIPLCSRALQEVEKEGSTIWTRWPLVSSSLVGGWGRMGDEDGIGGLETKKEATARLEPVGRRRAVSPERAVRMTTPWLQLKWGARQAPSWWLSTPCCC